MPTTEIFYVPLVSGASPGDPDNHAASVIKSTFDTLNRRDGMQDLYFGTWVERPDHFQLMINWDTIGKHQDFTKDAEYEPFLKSFFTIAEPANAKAAHVDFKPDGGLIKALSAPVTEVATLYFDGKPPSDHIETVKQFVQACEDTGAGNEYGLSGWAFGSTYEEVETDGVKGCASVLTLGWASVEKHMAFRQTQVFKDKIHLVRRGAKKIEMHHVAFMTAQ